MVDKVDCKTKPKENDNVVTYYVEEDFEYFGHLELEVSRNIVWKRVIDINEDPCLLEDHDNYIDGYISAGTYSASWFPVLFTMLRCNSFISSVFGDLKMQDNFNRNTYDGSFVFYFHGKNQWFSVKIDDRLPFMSDSNKNMFSISSNKDEYLSSLLEKAYARFLGGYGKFQSTNFIEAMMHFTGGVIEEVTLTRGLDPMTIPDQKCVFNKIRSLPCDTVAICHTSVDNTLTEENTVTGDGALPEDHYYLIKGSTSVPVKSRSNVVLSVVSSITDFSNKLDTADLVRLHNPVLKGDWGGSYNLGSQEWESMSENVRRFYNLKFDHEFEFWISMNDFCRNMSAALFCHIPNERRIDSILKSVSTWHLFHERGNCGSNIPGGSLDQLKQTFLDNGQYLVDVITTKDVTIKAVLEVEHFDQSTVFRDGCGLTVLKVENNRSYRLHDVSNAKEMSFKTTSSTAATVTISMVMPHGRYVIIPWRNGGLDVFYYLRMYTSQKSVTVTLLIEDQPAFVDCFKCSVVKTLSRAKDSLWTTISKESVRSEGRETHNKKCSSCIVVNPVDAIRFSVIGALNLETKFNQSRSNSYFILRCGNYSFKSTIKTVTNSPVWDDDFIFYRVDPAKDLISVEIFYEEKFGFDKSVGIHVFNQYEISRAEDDELTAPLLVANVKEIVPTNSKIRVKLKAYSPSQFCTL